MKIRLQQQKGSSRELLKYKGPVNCARMIIREEGLRGPWAGAAPTVMRNGLNQGALVWYISVMRIPPARPSCGLCLINWLDFMRGDIYIMQHWHKNVKKHGHFRRYFSYFTIILLWNYQFLGGFGRKLHTVQLSILFCFGILFARFNYLNHYSAFPKSIVESSPTSERGWKTAQVHGTQFWPMLCPKDQN